MLRNFIATFPQAATWFFRLIETDLDKVDAIATDYLRNIKNPIRLFVTFGPGYGDQVCAVNILDRLLSLGYQQRSVDIVGKSFTLAKIMLLLGIDNKLNNSEIVEATLENGCHVRFINYDFFEKNLQNFPKAELAIFTGIWEQVVQQYGSSQLTVLAKASRVLSFDPFTIAPASQGPAIAYELERQLVQHSYLSTVLPYRITLPDGPMIEEAIKRFHKQNVAAKTIKKIMQDKNIGRANTFAIYGLDKDLHPNAHFSSVNLINAAANVRNISDKPLYVMIFNTWPDKWWQELQKIFAPTYTYEPKYSKLNKALQQLSKKITLVDLTRNSTIPNIFKRDKQIFVFRMPPLPKILFNELFNSTLISTYEGAGAASLLEEGESYGLPCRRTLSFLPVDCHFLPQELISASSYTCRDDFSTWISNGNGVSGQEVLTYIMEKYSNMTRPLKMKPDRVAYAVAKVSQEADCETQPSKCAFFKPAENIISNAISMHGVTATKGFFYGVLEKSTELILRKVNFSENTATFASKITRMSTQFAIEGFALSVFLLFLLSSIGDATLKRSAARGHVNTAFKALMYLLQFSFFIIEFEPTTIFLVFTLMATALVSEKLGSSITQTIFGKKTTQDLNGSSVERNTSDVKQESSNENDDDAIDYLALK